MTRRFFYGAIALTVIFSVLEADFPVSPSGPVHAQAQYSTVLKQVQERRYQEAFVECQRLIEREPQPLNAYQRLAELANETKQVAEAITFLKQLPTHTREQQALQHYGIAAVYAFNPRHTEHQLIADHSRQALSYNPNLTKAYQLLVDSQIALGQDSTIDGYLKTLLVQAPQNALAHLWFGYFCKQRGQYDSSLTALDMALVLDPELLDAIYEKVNVYVRIKDEAKQRAALTLGQQLLQKAEQQRNLEFQIKAHRMMGYAYNNLNDRSKALHSFRAGLQLAESAGALVLQTSLLANLCNNYTELDDYAQALDTCRQGLASALSGSREWDLGNLGFAFRRLGDTQTGIAYYKQSLEVAKEKKCIDCQTWMLTNLGEAQADLGEYEESEGLLREALRLARQTHNRFRESHALASLGKLYYEKKEYGKALEYQREAYRLACEEQHKPQEARSLISLGAAYFKLKDWKQSLASYEAAREFGERFNSARTIWLAHSGMAGNYRQIGKHAEAEQQYRHAIEAIEKTRSRITEDNNKVSFWQDKVKIYKDLISLLMESATTNQASRHRATLSKGSSKTSSTSSAIETEAFQLSEQWRARAFLDLLSESGSRTERGTQSGVIRQPIDLSAVQQLLDPQTVVLSYTLDQNESLLFGVTREQFEVYRLPSENLINDCTSKLLDTLTAKAQSSLQDYRIEASTLYEKLVAPARGLLAGKKTLIIIPDGLLQRLPFEVLLKLPAKKTDSIALADLPYLIKDFAISYAPSVSIWVHLHQSTRNGIKAPKEFVAFGDPLYPENAQGLFASLLGRNKLQQLRYSQGEMARIGALFGKNSSVTIYQGAQANEAVVKREGIISQYRYVHFSVHAGINEAIPRVSGLLLSLPANANTETSSPDQGDGVLTAEEIMKLRLNAELVSLSACDTGLGKLVNGEGLMGLMRAFIYAGTPSVVVSLWKVDDRATADLMEDFYKYLLRGKKNKNGKQAHLNKAEALREAQLEAIRDGSAPYYWAPFVLEGHP